MTYSYFGLLVGKIKVSLALLAATATTGHAAVWLGASYGQSRWVQAGIAQAGDQRFAYIETRTPRRYQLLTFPAPPSAVVRLAQRGPDWRVTIAGRTSRWVYVPYASRIACLELFGDSHATALIDGRRVRH